MDNEQISFLIPTLSINIKSLTTTFIVRDMHFHNSIELVRIDKGNLKCKFVEDSIILHTGDVLLINRRVIHQLQSNNGECTFAYIQIDMDRYFSTLTNKAEYSVYSFMHSRNYVPYMIFHEGSELHDVFFNIVQEYENKKSCYESYIYADIYRIRAIMQRHGLFPVNEDNVNDKTINRLLPAIEYAEKNYSNKISLDTASKTVNMDKFYFCKMFKKAIGATFIEYINFLRIQQSQYLLTNTDMNISQIAQECGFDSTQYFNRVFKKRNDCLPTTYRKLHL